MWQKLQTLPNQQTHRGKILYWHIRDGAVWHQHRKIRRADPATLEVFQTDGGSGFIARENPADWNTERARTTDVMRVMRHIAQAQADDTAA